jgi:hypothetical protein
MAAVLAAGATALTGAVPGRAADRTTAAVAPAGWESVSAERYARMRAQIPLARAATVLQKAVEHGPADGYAGVGLTGDHVTLWWKGDPPAQIRAAVRDARLVAPVDVASAEHSRTELNAAARTVMAGLDADGLAASARVRLRADGSGLLVQVAADSPATPRLAAVDVPAQVVREQRQVPRSRDDDTPAWRAGMIMGGGGACTAGFGVRDAAGNTYLLTAAHCGVVGAVYNDGAGEQIGTMVQRRNEHDIALIRTGPVSNTIYSGYIDDERQLVVSGYTLAFPGQLLCQSGRSMAHVTGGPMCNIEVQYHYPPDLPGVPYHYDLVEARQLDDHIVAYAGDSGGPVYAAGPNGTVLAAGTVNRSAGSGLGFQDFATIIDDFGVRPVTGTTGACHVDYQVTGSWPGQFNVNVTIRNNGPAITGGWRLDFTYSNPGHQSISTIWQATRTQTGEQVTVRSVPSNGSIPSGGEVTFGFTANSDEPETPGLFALNGAYCG